MRGEGNPMPGPEPPFPSKKADKPVICGTNLYRDKSVGDAHGNWHATEQEATNDKKNVERSAENDAWVNAKQDAVKVAERKCPRECRHKHSHDHPSPVQPFYRPAEIT